MRLFREIAWLWKAYPRVPEKAGLLMRIYFFWSESIGPAGHVVSALLLFGAFFLFAPGFFALKVAVLFLAVALILSLCTRRRPRNRITRVEVPLGMEGAPLRLLAALEKSLQKNETLESFRMDSSLENLGNGEILPHRRGVFRLPGIAVAAEHPSGLVRSLSFYGKVPELLVAPQIFPLKSFSFLTLGQSGAAFERLFQINRSRGTEFIGVREYHDGDSPRDLHAKAFARFGRPFTKEYARESGGGVTLLLDVSASRIREKMGVEFAVGLCGSIALWLLERGLLLRFFIGNSEVRLGSSDDRHRILEALARVPRAKIRGNFEMEKWNASPDADSPVLCVAVRPVPWNVDKQIVVVDEPQKSPSDAVKFVVAGEEVSL